MFHAGYGIWYMTFIIAIQDHGKGFGYIFANDLKLT